MNQPETKDEWDQDAEIEALRVPHILDVFAQVRASSFEIEAVLKEADRLLGDTSDPLNRAVAQMLLRSLLDRVKELRLYAEIG